MIKRLVLATALLALAGCSTVSEMFSDFPKQVAMTQVTLATSEHIALKYAQLPVCGKTSAVLCRTPAITAKIGAADQAAFTAVQAARIAEDETSLQAAETAVGALKQITDGLNVGAQP